MSRRAAMLVDLHSDTYRAITPCARFVVIAGKFKAAWHALPRAYSSAQLPCKAHDERAHTLAINLQILRITCVQT